MANPNPSKDFHGKKGRSGRKPEVIAGVRIATINLMWDEAFEVMKTGGHEDKLMLMKAVLPKTVPQVLTGEGGGPVVFKWQD